MSHQDTSTACSSVVSDVIGVYFFFSRPPQHIVKCHGSTLLPQFLGMYRVSVDNEETYLLVMRNMFSHRLLVHRKYDLKVRTTRHRLRPWRLLIKTQNLRTSSPAHWICSEI